MVYRNIEERCSRRGVAISALEKAVGLGNGTVKGWRGSSPSVANLKKVADYFGCTVDELLEESEVAAVAAHD